MKLDGKQKEKSVEKKQQMRITGLSYSIIVMMSAFGILLCVNQLFQLNLAGFMPIASGYYYYILALFLSVAFLIFPGRKNDSDRLRWYDLGLFFINISVNVYFAVNAETILTSGWEFAPPKLPLILSYVLWALALEGVRRTAGTALFLVCLVFSFYPLYGQYLKGILWGTPFTLAQTASYHALGVESIIGIATRVVGDELMGYIIFGAAIVSSGGGKFFMDFALSLLGQTRGGAAKVAILSSAFMASLSGSVVSNIVTTGTLTIPAMKKTGYRPLYAASIEACSSTGGTITPPIMGAAGFLIASFLNVPYIQVMLAALIPAFFYFFVLFLQTDLHAAKERIEGFETSQIPKLSHTLKNGWFFIGAIVLMIVLLLFFRVTAIAPFYTIIFLFSCTFFQKETRLTWKKLGKFFYESGVVLSQITAILAGIGLIIGAFSATGVANSFSRELILLAGENILLLLALGALTSFVLGIGMTVTACYVFLAVVLVPALVKVGLDPMASHLFVLFCGNLSYITPPVALGAISAAAIAGSKPMETAFKAVQLGFILFVVPFLFVANPALILNGSVPDIIMSIIQVLIGCVFISFSLEGWAFFFGFLNKAYRIVFFIAGALTLYPLWITGIVGLITGITVMLSIKVFPCRETMPMEC